jgi:mevalonate kinase
MKQVQATAPGKIILFGEHAVVYGRPAIAVPLADIRAEATLQQAEASPGFRIVAPDLQQDYLVHEAGSDDALAKIIHLTLEHLGQNLPQGVVLEVTSTIPLGRGLGSGAAISTAIARALGHFFEQPLSPADISKLVFEVEKLYHGTPSGIDNTVIAFEQPVYFIKGVPLRRIGVGQPFTLVIGDTGVIASTKEVVGDLRRRWQADQEYYEGYFDEISIIAQQARVMIERGVLDLSKLGKLMNENQELLEAIGVSASVLERLIGAARQAGAAGAKLSGAGWGGNMIALVPSQPEAITAVVQALRSAGAVGVMVTEVK